MSTFLDPSVAVWALLALAVVIVLASWRAGLNAGLLAITAAFGIGLYLSDLKLGAIAGFFPVQLFLTLVGVAHFFEMARLNGALDWLAGAAMRLARGNSALLPVVFFALTFGLSAIGPGNIAATAMVAPIAMAAAVRMGVNPLLMAIMVCTGANAGAFSPVSLTGSINVGLMTDIGITDPLAGWQIFTLVAMLQSTSALGAWLIFGRRLRSADARASDPLGLPAGGPAPLSNPGKGGPMGIAPAAQHAHALTFAAMGGLLVLVLVFQVPTVVAAFVLAALLALSGAGNAEEALRTLPWGVIAMVTGISLLIGLIEDTGGLDLATGLIATYASPGAINAVLAGITGVVSIFSSSSGVVLPTFMPLVPGLIERLGGGDLWRMVIAIDIGSHMVDVSPLSTLGALCLAALPETANKQSVFRGLLLWGFAMAAVAALLALVFLDLM
jgi:Na+/H+ antiporter NhaD/arsenite permease-like protein